MDGSPEKEGRKRPPDPIIISSVPSTQILSWVSVGDVIAFGATCHAFHQLSYSPGLWRVLCRRQEMCLLPETSPPRNWRRMAILSYTQALYLHTLGGGGGGSGRGAFPMAKAINPPLALGFKCILPTCDNHFLWDEQGTVFMLYDSVTLSPRGQLVWSEASRNSVLCHNVKDVTVGPNTTIAGAMGRVELFKINSLIALSRLPLARQGTAVMMSWSYVKFVLLLPHMAEVACDCCVGKSEGSPWHETEESFTADPRSDVSHRQYLYVLVTRPLGSQTGGRLRNGVTLKQCDSVEIYHQYTGERVFHMTFHPSLTFSQLRLMGPEANRTLLLLTGQFDDSGKVYTVPLNETQLDRPRSFTVQLTLRQINHSLPDLPVKQIHTSYSSALYITGTAGGDSSVYVETHSAGVHRHLFGTLQGFSPNNGHAPILLPLPFKLIVAPPTMRFMKPNSPLVIGMAVKTELSPPSPPHPPCSIILHPSLPPSLPAHSSFIPLSLPTQVVKCSLGLTHLCLLEESGRVYMQGSNNHGQLGTGDKIDRREPTQVVLSLAPVDVFCGLNHSLALLRGATGEKEVQGCGCGRGGRLPGWAQGSPVFVRLNVKVPRNTRALCSSKYYLYLLCCHDIEEAPLFRVPLPDKGAESEGELAERLRLQKCLSQLRGCGHLQEQLATLREAVLSHMTLNSAQKDFLEEALSTMQQGSSSTTESHN
ncbi:hypothetical protein JZ751_024347 [Albula glossodonta]|uniref:Uncharacterized protein n=1 Tax=Albula glossodonta TaxID=121402 RepID=A0A8T2NRJ1_9TELE|nr:hypothetical protein JZ751_024347 [Albula glossodonta]